MIATNIEAIVQQALSETLGSFGFERAEVYPYVDHVGDDALSIVAHFKPSAPSVERPTARAMGVLRRRLLAVDEERFPYLTFAFPDEELLIDDTAAVE